MLERDNNKLNEKLFWFRAILHSILNIVFGGPSYQGPCIYAVHFFYFGSKKSSTVVVASKTKGDT
jgi:hypothetical protein